MAHAMVNLDKMPAACWSGVECFGGRASDGVEGAQTAECPLLGKKERPGGAVAASGGPGLLARARDGISRRA